MTLIAGESGGTKVNRLPNRKEEREARAKQLRILPPQSSAVSSAKSFDKVMLEGGTEEKNKSVSLNEVNC
jgi:hypothetical protein